MKAKKLLALLLATLMLALACPLTAFASDNSVASVTIYNPYNAEGQQTEETTYHTTFNDALTAAQKYNVAAPGGDYGNRKNIVATIKILVSDITVNHTESYKVNTSLVIDGEYEAGKKANVTCPNGFWLKHNNNLTIKNMNVTMTAATGAMFMTQAQANSLGTKVEIDNVVFTGYTLFGSNEHVPNFVANNSTINLTGGYAAILSEANKNITFNNCVVTKAAGQARDVFLVSENTTSDVVLNLHDTVVTQNGGNGGWVYSNIVSHNGTGTLTVNLTGNTRLNQNSDQTNGGGGSPMFMGWNHPMVLNIGSDTDDGSGVVLNLGAAEGENAVSKLLPCYFRRFSSLTVNDKGGTWMSDASFGNFRGYWNDGSGSAIDIDGIIGFTKDGTVYDEFNMNIPVGSYKTMTTADVKAAVTNGFGASIRTVDPDGIRFKTNFDKDFYDTYKNSAVFGAKVTTKDKLIAAQADFAAAEGLTTPTGDELNWEVEGESLITVLTNIGVDKYDVVFYVTGFITVNYANNSGKTVTVYADYTEDANARSVRYVAEKALEDATNGNYTYSAAQLAYIQAIVNANT